MSIATAPNGKIHPHEEELSTLKLDLQKEYREITLTWENIDVHLPSDGCCAKLPCFKKESKRTHILDHANGIAKPGKVLAVMGASGSGKTTLLNCLNFRNRGSLQVSGQVKINGQEINSTQGLQSISGYIQQEDLFIGTLKVKEHLKFQAMLRMDGSLTNEQKMNRVEEILNELNLKKCEDSLIGIPEKNIKGISGGEKRRLAFASEVITNPSLLFADEPTSGLDSFMAVSVVESMKNLARQGKTIVCTIHQPSSEIFAMFDQLCLVAEGRIAFIGDLKDAIGFFDSQGYKCPSNYNPSDFFIRTLAIAPNDRENCLATVKKVCDNFETSSHNQALKASVEKSNQLKHDNNYATRFDKKAEGFKTNIFTQTFWLFWRAILGTARDTFSTILRVFQTFFISIILGLIFLQLKNDQSGIQNKNGLLFLFITNASFSNMFAVINSFPAEIPILMKEHKNGMYRVLPYLASKILVELPFYVLLPLASTTILYWMANLNNGADRFFICCAIVILVTNASVSFGRFLSAVAPSINVALGLSGPVLVPLMIFSGVFLNNSSVPSYFLWLRYLSWFSYAYEILTINQWEGVSSIECTTNVCLNNGTQVLNQLSMATTADSFAYRMDVGAICILIAGWTTITYLVLVLKTYLSKS